MADAAARLELYKKECREHLQKIREALVALATRSEPEAVKNIHRSAHTIKGISSLMGFIEMAQPALEIEDLMEKIEEGNTRADAWALSKIQTFTDQLTKKLASLELDEEVRARETSPQAAKRPVRNILIVEDDTLTASLLHDMIEQHEAFDLRAQTVFNLAEACESLASQAFDLIILDLTLPDSAGIVTLNAVKKNCGKTPVLVMTGSREEVVSPFTQNCIRHVFLKGNINISELLQVITQSLQPG